MLTTIKVVPDLEPNAEGHWIRIPDVMVADTTRWTERAGAAAAYIPAGYHMVGYDVVGRERDHAFHVSWLHRLIHEVAWPTYTCEQCVGQEEWRGCECWYKGAVAPGVEPEWWHWLARRLWLVVERRSVAVRRT